MSTSPIRFHYSLRSPYVWLAAERIVRDGIDVVPIASVRFARGTNFGDPVQNPPRLSYLIEDVARLAARLGLTLARPADTADWTRVHNAAETACRLGAGPAFIRAAARARWTQGADLANADTISDVARETGLDPDILVAAMSDDGLRAEMDAAYGPLIDADQVFGVPFFAFDGPDGRVHRYWGQDRIGLMLEDAQALGVL